MCILYYLSFTSVIHQASEESSLRALESLMTEFFHSCTTNERKREIGMFVKYVTANQKRSRLKNRKLSLIDNLFSPGSV